jgi:hypothetical protein
MPLTSPGRSLTTYAIADADYQAGGYRLISLRKIFYVIRYPTVSTHRHHLPTAGKDPERRNQAAPRAARGRGPRSSLRW